MDTEKKLDRKAIRAALLGKRHEPKSKIINIWGIDLELRQASLSTMLDAQVSEDTKVNAVNMIIRYSYVPGTDELVFEDTDRDEILSWPFGEELQLLQDTVMELTGVDIDGAEEELKENPLKD